jgi:thioesterase domain-containing protein
VRPALAPNGTPDAETGPGSARGSGSASGNAPSDAATGHGAHPGITPLLRGPSHAAPLYLIHPVGGSLMCYLPLARSLAGQHPVRGIASPLLAEPASGYGPDTSAFTRMSWLAEHYAGMIHADTDAPCLVGGWSFGGAAAFETAARLLARDHPVRLLVLLDAPPPGSTAGPLDDAELAGQFLHEVRRMTGATAEEARAGSGNDPLSAAAEEILRGDPDADPAEVRRRFAAFRHHTRSLLQHRDPAPYPGPVLLVHQQPAPGAPPSGDGWLPYLTGPVHRLPLPTDHYGLIGPASTPAIGAAVRHALNGG